MKSHRFELSMPTEGAVNTIPDREKIIEIVRQLCKKLKFSDQTFHLAVHYMDVIYLDKVFTRNQIYVYVVACLLTAGKITLLF